MCHNTWGDVITTNMREENHEVSRVGVHGWRSYDARMCCEEWANQAAPDHGRRLVIEWTADLSQATPSHLLKPSQARQ
jgi:hypothetical protein